MNKKRIIVIGIIALITVVAVVAVVGLIEQPPPNNVELEPAHRARLRDLVGGMELTFEPVPDPVAHYILRTADKELAGFVFLGTKEGARGPINLFVITDAAGIIQRVYVWHHTETPRYVVELDVFLGTFAGHNAEAVLIWQEDVHGITGATKTATAIIAAVHEAGDAAYQKGIFIRR
jgi:uncharacterized protein with FMN-binding domain